jgi:SAM-dependent methyltransferase
MEKSFTRDYADMEEKHWWFCVRKDIIVNEIDNHIEKNTKAQIVLNIGSGGGATSALLKKYGTVTSLDINHYLCKKTQEKNTRSIQAALPKLPFSDNMFDLVCAFDTLEHVKEEQPAVEEIIRVTKKNGIIVLTVPAMQALWSKHDSINHHYRRYSRKRILCIFSRALCLRITYFNLFLFPFIFLYRKIENRYFPCGKSDFEVGGVIASKILQVIFSLEANPLKAGFSFPCGVSLLAVFRKVI